jgi:Trk-type K+ transport system membrane component
MKFNLKKLYNIAFSLSLIALICTIIDFGFPKNNTFQLILKYFYFIVLSVGLFTSIVRYIENTNKFKRKAIVFDILSVSFTIWIFYIFISSHDYLKSNLLFKELIVLKLAVFFTFIREFSELKINFNRTFLNPAQIFIISFIIIIIIGALLLLLPNATQQKISFIDALFTSTSAVCVTGLAVVDTNMHFTKLGQSIILLLIQVGGLGILTFASYFSYFFKDGTTYENHLALGDITSSKKLGEVFSILKYIILITIGIEAFSAFLIYISVQEEYFNSYSDQIFFSIFHAVSAFCNAGFSTLSNSLYESDFRFNYFFHIIIILTFVLGGLGFPIVVNLLSFLKYKLSILNVFSKNTRRHKPWLINLDSRITLITTISISIIASIFFFIFEYHNTLAEHSGFGKIVTAIFGATTPRTAGFNSIDSSKMMLPTVMMVMLLMWIGASPQSTGGGIKTSTFAVLILNILALAKGKTRIEVFRREIADISVKRSFAIVTLSLFVVGFAVTLITYFDPKIELKDIVFECFSAYGTAGLSLGITSKLSIASKLVLIIVMFIGRVSMLSIAIAIFRKVKHKNYRYPNEEITIN